MVSGIATHQARIGVTDWYPAPSDMPDLLLELGVEELPASFVERAMHDLRGTLADGLRSNGIGSSDGVVFGTPRRIIVAFHDLAERQEDSTKEQRGPALKAAYAPDGSPTAALLGFCRSQGVQPDALRKDEQYVWATKHIPGRSTPELLAELLPSAIRALSFDKSMRWGTGRMRFARPIRWILAVCGGEPIPFELEGVSSGVLSRGHRFYAPETFEARELNTLLTELRARFVEPDPAVRRQRVELQSREVASGAPEMTDALIDENVFLTEWPTAIQGEYPESFLELPEPVLVTAMAKHEKMFPVRDASGALTNRFVFIRNSGEDDSVRRGAAWVLNARFNDARFFFEEDRKYSLSDFLAKTEGILFQQKLGTVRSRADRLAALSEEIAKATGASDEEALLARTAGLYAKADLSTGLVSELAGLQGIIGGEYAKREGMPAVVCQAIATQYDLGRSSGKSDLAALTGIRLLLADQLDKLAGYLGLGLEPTGSSDPYGLRRAATLLIEAAWAWPAPMPAYDQLLDFALEQYRIQGVDLDEGGAHRALYDLFASRYTALLPEARYDVLEAAVVDATSWEVTLPRQVRFRAQLLAEVVSDTGFVQTATRPLNIVAAAKKKGVRYAFEDPLAAVDEGRLSESGVELYGILRDHEDALFVAAREEQGDETLRLVRTLEGPINRFFDATMVMDENEDVRYANLSLLHACCLHLLRVGDFSKLVG